MCIPIYVCKYAPLFVFVCIFGLLGHCSSWGSVLSSKLIGPQKNKSFVSAGKPQLPRFFSFAEIEVMLASIVINWVIFLHSTAEMEPLRKNLEKKKRDILPYQQKCMPHRPFPLLFVLFSIICLLPAVELCMVGLWFKHQPQEHEALGTRLESWFLGFFFEMALAPPQQYSMKPPNNFAMSESFVCPHNFSDERPPKWWKWCFSGNPEALCKIK